MSETGDRAALIIEAEQMSRYVQNGGPDDGTVYDRLAAALAEQATIIEAVRDAVSGSRPMYTSEEEWRADQVFEVRSILNRTNA